MAEDFIPKTPWKGMRGIVKWKNGQTLQVKEEGGVMVISTPLQPTAGIQGPLQPLPHQKILFTHWSSVGLRSPPVVPPAPREPIEGTPITSGVGDIHEVEQEASQPSQPISMGSHIDDTGHAVQEDLSPIQMFLDNL